MLIGAGATRAYERTTLVHVFNDGPSQWFQAGFGTPGTLRSS